MRTSAYNRLELLALPFCILTSRTRLRNAAQSFLPAHAIQVAGRTELGMALGAAFCGVRVWAAENLERVENTRRAFDTRPRAG